MACLEIRGFPHLTQEAHQIYEVMGLMRLWAPDVVVTLESITPDSSGLTLDTERATKPGCPISGALFASDAESHESPGSRQNYMGGIKHG